MAKVMCRIATAVVALALVLPGCSYVDDTLERFDRAIDEVRKLQRVAQNEAAEMRRFFEERQTQATKDVRDIIREEFREAYLELGIEVRCLTDMIEGKLLYILKAIENVLLTTRARIERTGSSEGITPEALVAQILEERRHAAPNVCHCTPPGGVPSFALQTGAGAAPKLIPERPELPLLGYGLKRPKDDRAVMSLFVGPDLKAMREVPNSADMLFAVSSYRLNVDLEKLAEHLRPTDHRLELRWGDERLSQIKLSLTNLKPSVKKRVYVRLQYLDVYRTGLNKEYWQMRFTVGGGSETYTHPWNFPRVMLDPNSKSEEVGPDNFEKKSTRFPLGNHDLGPVNLREGDTLFVSCCGVASVSDWRKELVRSQYRKKTPPEWLKETEIVPTPDENVCKTRFGAHEDWGLTQEPLTADGAKYRIGAYSRQLGGPAYWAYFTIREAK